METTDIFSNLLKGRSNSPEDFLTEAFAFILREWFRADPTGCRSFLNCTLDGKFTGDEEIRFYTQFDAGSHGRPDLCIRSENALYIIENKWEAEVDRSQLRRYSKFLNTIELEDKKLFLFTVFHPTVRVENLVDKHIYWREIHLTLRKVFCERQNAATDWLAYLVSNFLKFMEDNDMTITQVSWQLVEGIRALIALHKQIYKALTEIDAQEITVSWGANWAGYRFSTNELGSQFKMWFGFSFKKPEILGFEVFEYPPLHGNMPDPLTVESGGLYIRTTFQQLHFFSLTDLEQVDALKTCIQSGVQLVKQNLDKFTIGK